MGRRIGWVALGAGLAVAACDGDPSEPGGEVVLAFDFDEGAQGWTAGFADYPAGEEAEHGLGSGMSPLPEPLDASRTAFRIEGVNHSDDLFMYLTREVDGLQAGARYRVTYEIELATDAPAGCFGVGGAPGESVFVKAGAAPMRPETSVDGGGHERLNVDHGAQAEEGQHARVLGDVATTNDDCFDPVYELKMLETTQALEVEASGDGRLWLIVGTDSGYESLTRLYYTRIEATLTPVGS